MGSSFIHLIKTGSNELLLFFVPFFIMIFICSHCILRWIIMQALFVVVSNWYSGQNIKRRLWGNKPRFWEKWLIRHFLTKGTSEIYSSRKICIDQKWWNGSEFIRQQGYWSDYILFYVLCLLHSWQCSDFSDWKSEYLGSSCPWEWRGGMFLTHFPGFQLLFTQTYAYFDINTEGKATHRFQNQNLEILLTCPMPLSLRLDWNPGIST